MVGFARPAAGLVMTRDYDALACLLIKTAIRREVAVSRYL